VHVCTKEEAEYAVKCCKYPPRGFRGVATSQRATTYGLEKNTYVPAANDTVVVMVAIETYEAVQNIEEIAAVEGVDGIFIGPADLSTSMGHLINPAHPDVQEAIRHVEEVTLKSGKFLATVSSGGEDARKKYDRGYSLLYPFSDTSNLALAASHAVTEFRNYLSEK